MGATCRQPTTSSLRCPRTGRRPRTASSSTASENRGSRTDTHVHRVSNRRGLVRTKTPGATEKRLMRTVSKEYWLHINELFIRFGKDLCRPIGPQCPRCSFTDFFRFYPRTKWGKLVSKTARRAQVHRSRRPSRTHD